MTKAISALEKFDQLCNDLIDSQRIEYRAERDGTTSKTPNENTIRSAQMALAEFVMLHQETIRAALYNKQRGKK